jgi:predicted enzyme related to lactoylglutathione lyase
MAAWTAYVQVEDVAGCAAVAVESGGAVLVPPVAGGPAEDAARVMAVLADPSGAALGVASGGAGVEASGVPGAYGMSALHSPDLAAAATFYGTVFGWTLVETGDPRLAEWRLAGRDRPVAVASPIAPGSGVPPHWAVNVLVADADATCAAAAALGGGVLMGPVDSPGFRSAVLADPQGGVLAVSAWS